MRAFPTSAVQIACVVVVLVAFGACDGANVRHPLAGRARPVRTEPGYWVWHDDGWLHVRVTSGERNHRFQGSLTALNKAPLGQLELDRPEMSQEVALQGDSVQFDLEPGKGREEGFRVHSDACVRFDLYVDGSHKAERVHLGKRPLSPKAVPFERCP
jgi:hypothetical protein